jgi:hypothetical protein
MKSRDDVRRDLLLLAELLQGARRRRSSAAAMCLAVQVLFAARDRGAPLADVGACFAQLGCLARGEGDLESAAAFEIAVDVTRAQARDDVAGRRKGAERAVGLGGHPL